MAETIVLQHATCETLGTIDTALVDGGISARYVRGDLGEPIPTSLGNAAALIVMGGPMGVYEQAQYPFLKDELLLIERTLAAGKPVLGVCLGSQLLAAALGANVRKGRRKEIGWHRIHMESGAAEDLLFQETPPEFEGFHWHGDIFDLPAGGVKLAHSDLTECQTFRVGRSYGILFHMEVTATSVHGMVDTFAEELTAAGVSPEQILSETKQHLAQLQAVGTSAFRRWAAALDTSQVA